MHPDDAPPLQRYYRSYSIAHRDVAVLELESSLEVANRKSKLYGQMASAIVALIAVLATIVLGESHTSLWSQPVDMSRNGAFLVAVFILGLLVLLYFSELQKTITLNARKAITLRGALGLDYSPLQLTLPSWRLEGATNPFAVRLFPGWLSVTAYPLWALLALLIGSTFITLQHTPMVVAGFHIQWYVVAALGALLYAAVFRRRLFEEHEDATLQASYLLARFLHVELLSHFSYILFRAKLAAVELERLGFDLSEIKNILVAVEDARFYSHRGVSARGLFRAFLSQTSVLRRKYGWSASGGSTIPMQLARTLLIAEYEKTWRRKILEIPLAIWIDSQFDKDHLLKLYLASVRFERGVYGVPAAVRYFLGDTDYQQLTSEEAFFLVERLSNVRSRYRPAKVGAQLKQANAGRSQPIDSDKVFALYQRTLTAGVLNMC